jgi:Flp pilus assembly protein TadG
MLKTRTRTRPPLLKRWLECRRGNVAIVFALGASVLAGGAALAVETSYDYYRQVSLQAAADAAAYAGAVEQRTGAAATAVQAAAQTAAGSNGWSASAGSIQVNSPPSSGAYAGQPQAVEVTLSQATPRFFSAVFTPGALMMRTRAVAIYQTAQKACVLALDPTKSQAVDIQGSANATFSGCELMADSLAADAVDIWGSAVVKADCVVSAGGVQDNGGLTTTACAAPQTQAPRVADPFAALPTPEEGEYRTVPSKGGALSPGYYPDGMTLNGTYSLSPGVYYVAGSGFSTNGNAVVTGSGVTIFLAAGAQTTLNANATITLSAPTSGTYAGILFFGDRAAAGGVNKFNGAAGSSLTGNLYFPTQELQYNGNFSGQNGCMHIVADTVSWSGSATMNVDCASAGMAEVPAVQPVRLVE